MTINYESDYSTDSDVESDTEYCEICGIDDSGEGLFVAVQNNLLCDGGRGYCHTCFQNLVNSYLERGEEIEGFCTK